MASLETATTGWRGRGEVRPPETGQRAEAGVCQDTWREATESLRMTGEDDDTKGFSIIFVSLKILLTRFQL